MLNQLKQVLLTYTTRPLMWILGGVYIIFLAAVLYRSAQDFRSTQSPTRQRAYPGITVMGGSTLFLNSAERVAEFERGQFDVKATNAEIRWYLSGSPTPAGIVGVSATGLRSLTACQKLRSLQIYCTGFLSDEEGAALGELAQLEFLTINGVGISSSLWTQLGRMPRLRYLDLSGCSFWGDDYPHLERLTRLETLVLGSPGNAGFVETDAPLLPELHRLPKLRTLVMGDRYHVVSAMEARRQLEQGVASSPTSTKLKPRDETIEQIRSISTLRTLFVEEMSATFPGFDTLQRDLPSIRVRPAFVDPQRMGWLAAVYMLNALVLLLISSQVHSHFAHPGAHLVPNYVRPHLILPIVLWSFSLPVHSLPLLAHGVAFVAAIGVNFGCWGVVVMLGITSTLNRMDMRKWPVIGMLLSVIAGLVAGAWVPLMVVAPLFLPSTVDWYLRGQEPLWAWSFIALGGVGPIVLVNMTVRLYSTYLERGFGAPPLGLDMVAFPAWQRQAYWRQQAANTQFNPIYRRITRRLEDVIASSALPGWIRRCNLWIAGNMADGNLAPLMVIFLSLNVLFFVQIPRLLDWDFEFSWRQNPGGLMLSTIFPDLPVLLLAGLWRGRRRLLAIESLRPVSRTQFGRQIAAAIAWDLVPLWVGYLGCLMLYAMLADPQRWSWSWTAAMLLVFVARWILIYGLMLWVIVIRRDWVLLLTAIIAGYTVVCVNMLTTLFLAPILGVQQLPSDLPNFSSGVLAGIGLVMGAIACLIALVGYRRWQRIELV